MMSSKAKTEPDTEECITLNAPIEDIEELDEVYPTAEILGKYHEVSNQTSSHSVEDDPFKRSESIAKHSNELDILKTESLRYVAGYVAFKLQEKYSLLGTKSCSVPVNSVLEFTWI